MKIYRFRLRGKREQSFQVPHPEHGGRPRPFVLQPGVVLKSDGAEWYERNQESFWLAWSELVESRVETVTEIPVDVVPEPAPAPEPPPAPKAEPKKAAAKVAPAPEPEPEAEPTTESESEPQPAPEAAPVAEAPAVVSPPGDVRLAMLTIDELREIATRHGIDPSGMNKVKLVEAIKAKTGKA